VKTIRRALRTILRSPLRTALLVAVLAVSIGLTLIMITVNEAFGARLDDIRAQVGTTITVRPAGSFGGGFIFRGGFGGGPGTESSATGEDSTAQQATLTDDELSALSSIEHVASYSRRITSQYTGDELQSTTIEPPEAAPAPHGAPAGGFQVPILVTGTDDPSSLASLGVQDAKIVEGRIFNSDEAQADVAVMGQTLAENNGLAVGDTFQLNSTAIKVVGIYSTGTQFGDNSLFLPLETARTVFDRAGEVDEVVVQADTASNVSQVADAIRAALGEDVADVSTQESAFDAISAPVSDAQSSSQVGMIAALVASAAVILFSVGLVARQRLKEIGIFKAIGASNWHVTAQFGIETVMVSVIAALIGALATFPLAQTVANGLVSDSTAPAGPGRFTVTGPGPGPGAVAGGAAVRIGGAGGFLGDVDVAVSPEVFLYALAIAIGLAVIASMIPAWYVARVKPAEVLRYE
jgi:putative ABC transport system permease protein